MITTALSGTRWCAISASPMPQLMSTKCHRKKSLRYTRARAFSEGQGEAADDCNTEECAPEKEVGTVSMEWVAGDNTKVVGTFPPRNRGWTGLIEKDTAGQTNIYSVEPAVYVAESAISSGEAGSSAEGAGNTVAVVSSIALISIAAASVVLLQVGKNPPSMQTTEYSGPSLSYYINKFKPHEIIEASAPAPTAPPAVAESPIAPFQAEAPAQEVSQPDDFSFGF